MSIYLGVKCPVCTRKFTSADDVVVCPTCGAPHHRECYAEKGTCAFEADHLSGKVWNAPQEAQPEQEPQTVQCPRCNGMNPPESSVCQICGMQLHRMPPPGMGGGFGSVGQGEGQGQAGYGWGFPGLESMMDPAVMMYGDLSPEESIDGEVVRDLALYVGESSAYYLARFKTISRTGRSLSFNFAALFFNFFYFFYRKMYLPGSILLGVYIVSLIPWACNFSEVIFPQMVAENAALRELFASIDVTVTSEVSIATAQYYARLSNISRFIAFFIGVIFSLCANMLYYRKVIASVRSLREQFGDKRDERAYVEALSQSGGYNRPAVAIVAVGLFLLLFLVSSVISFIYMTGG